MKPTKPFLPILFASIVLLLFSCADPKGDYEKIQKLQDANEQVIQRTADYDIKIKACDDSIKSIQGFLEKHKEGEWSKVAKNALQSWESRKAVYNREINSLTEQLFPLLQKRAVEESTKAHRASKLETMNLVTRDKSKEGNNINVKDTYSVRMRGTLAGVHIFKLTVKVTGHIAMDSKSVFVDSALVEE